MRGIKIKNGATFVQYNGITYRLSSDMEWGVSPVLYESLEWELRTEPPHTYDYIGEADIKALGNGVYEALLAMAERFDAILQ